MKFNVYFKTPGAGDDALQSVEDSTSSRREYSKAEALVEKWVKYGEYLTVEIDTEKETIRVLEVER